MRRQSHRRVLPAVIAAAGLLLAGCGDGEQAGQEPTDGQTGTEQTSGTATEGSAPDPAENIEDGVYAGNGVLLPVPDGFTVNPQALSQGIVAAVSQNGSQQLTGQAVDTSQLQGQSQDLDLDTLVDSVRSQIQAEPAVDEEVELANAERAHRLTYLEMPAQNQATPTEGTESAAPQLNSATIVLAESGDGLVGEFSYSASAEAYDQEIADVLVAEAGFDPDSDPPAVPQQPTAPTDGGTSSEGTASEPATEQSTEQSTDG